MKQLLIASLLILSLAIGGMFYVKAKDEADQKQAARDAEIQKKLEELEEKNRRLASDSESLSQTIQDLEKEPESASQKNAPRIQAPASTSPRPSKLSATKEASIENTARVEEEADDEPEVVEKKKTVVSDPMKAIVLVEGDQSSGTGFFVRHPKSIYLYTAAHVLSGNKKISIKSSSGRKFTKFGKLQVAKGIDLARMQVFERVPGALRLAKRGQIKMDQEILVIGNAGGGSVLNEAEGVIQGLGDVSFEISAEVIQGNSGGPILLKENNTVLGIVTHGISGRSDVWSAGTRYAEVRRFGARFDRRVRWVSLPLNLFLKEPAQIAKFNRVTRLLYALSVLDPGRNGMRLSTSAGGSQSALTILMENQSMKAVQALLRMNNDLASKNIKPSPAATRKRFVGFLRTIVMASEGQMTDIKSLSPYHKELSKGYIAERAKAHRLVSQKMRDLSR